MKNNQNGFVGVMTNFIKRTYRITKEQDKLVKRKSTKYISESEIVRQAIDKFDKPAKPV